MKKRERYILRDETFGGTLYDKKGLRNQYLTEEEIRNGIHFNGNKVDSYEHWTADTTSLPRNILYSPVRVYYEVTKICNLRCTHCFNSSGRRDPNELNTDEVFKSLEGMRNDHIFDIRFTGGEFTLRHDWYEILEKSKDLGFAISLNTNGVYKDEHTMDKLAALELSQITISIDGNRKEHDQIRGEGNYDKSIKSLRGLHERGAVLRTNTVLTGTNVSDMEKIIQTVGPYVKEMNFFHMRGTGRARNMQEEAITYEKLAEFNRQAPHVTSKYPGINIMFGSLVARQNSIRMNELGLKPGGPDGLTRFNLAPDGSISAGGYAPYINSDLILGNIKDEGYTMLKIWRESKRLKTFREFSRGLVERCLDCPELEVNCGGTNVEMELIKANFLDQGNPYCVYE